MDKDNITAYELMIKTNHYLIRGGELNDAQKARIARELYASRANNGTKRTFPEPHWYPDFFIPPQNEGKRLQTVVPMSPKTYIVADNAYEFEIMRLLFMFQPGKEVDGMIEKTLSRLKKTCFGYKGCHYADCFEAGLTVLRFLSTVAAGEVKWIKKQISVYSNHFADRKRHSGVQKYFWWILSEMSPDIALPEIARQKAALIEQINRGYAVKTGDEDIPFYIMRNILAQLPGYAEIANRKPYIEERSRKFKFDIRNSIL